MANYYGTTRSNYFAVKDPVEFLRELNDLPCNIVTKQDDEGQTLYGILDSNDDGGGLAWDRYNEELGDFEDIDWLDIFSRHLADGHVAVLLESGAEKYRYIIGYALAVNNKNERVRIDLQDIYSLASTLGSHVTQALY